MRRKLSYMEGRMEAEEEEEEANRNGGRKVGGNEKRGRTGPQQSLRASSHLECFWVFTSVLLLMSACVAGEVSRRKERFINPSVNVTTPKRDASLFVIGKDEKHETQTLLENVGLWNAVNWKTLYRYVGNIFTTQNLESGLTVEKAYYLSEGPKGSGTQIDAKDCLCSPLSRAVKNNHHIIVLFFEKPACMDDTVTNSTACLDFKEDFTNDTFIFMASRPVPTSPNATAESWTTFLKKLNATDSHNADFDNYLKNVYNHFEFTFNVPEFEDAAGWKKLLNIREQLNAIFKSIPEVVCFAKEPPIDTDCLGSVVGDNGHRGESCTPYQKVPETEVISDDLIKSTTCPEEALACRDCSFLLPHIKENETPNENKTETRTSEISENPLPLTLRTTLKPESGGLPLWVSAVIAGVAVAVIAIIAIIVFCCCCRKVKPISTPKARPPDLDSSNRSLQQSYPSLPDQVSPSPSSERGSDRTQEEVSASCEPPGSSSYGTVLKTTESHKTSTASHKTSTESHKTGTQSHSTKSVTEGGQKSEKPSATVNSVSAKSGG